MTAIDYSRELVINKARQTFPWEDLDEILRILDLYRKGKAKEGTSRVQIAILKLSEGKIDKLRSAVAAANGDYRDVLAWAEYPEEMKKHTWKMEDKEEVKKIRERDRAQYVKWLERKD